MARIAWTHAEATERVDAWIARLGLTPSSDERTCIIDRMLERGDCTLHAIALILGGPCRCKPCRDAGGMERRLE